MSLLALGLTKRFGDLVALDDVDLYLEDGEILGLIGQNGSGKTTLFNLLVNILRPEAGEVFLDGRPITGLATHRVCRLGLVKTAQIVQPFAGLSVLENVMVGGLFGQGLSLKQARGRAGEILEMVGLAPEATRPAGSLTVARRRRLELARALATGPRIILLDENMAGLTPAEMAEVIDLLRRINSSGVGLVVVEHAIAAVMNLCPRVAVLDQGRKIAEGTPQEVAARPEVVAACLGQDYA